MCRGPIFRALMDPSDRGCGGRISHTTQSLGELGSNPYLFGATPEGSAGLNLAGFGVTMFFALSGFLITYLLLLEKQKQSIDVRNFYIRRVLLIHPLYYTYLAIVLVVILAFGMKYSTTALLFYIFLAANIPFITNTTLPFLAGYWSLAVEEQFYLFYPWIVKWIDKLPRFSDRNDNCGHWVKCFFRYVHALLGTTPFVFLDVTRFQCMLIGAIGAWHFFRRDTLFLRLTTNIFVQIVSWFVILLIGLNSYHVASIFDHEIVSGVTVCLILGQVGTKKRFINSERNSLDFIGKISYGIYVLHPLVLFAVVMLLNVDLPSTAKYAFVYLSVTGISIIVAYLSYEYYEKWFLRLKPRFSVVVSSATLHKEL